MGFSANDFFKSKFLKAGDIDGPTNFTIRDVQGEQVGEQKELKAVLYLRGEQRGLILNKTNFAMLAKVYGQDTDAWANKPVTLIVEQVAYKGDVVDGIRVRIPKARTITTPTRPTAAKAATQLEDVPFPDDAETDAYVEEE